MINMKYRKDPVTEVENVSVTNKKKMFFTFSF